MIFLRKLFSKIQEKPILIVILITLLGLLLRIGNPFYASPILYALSDEASNYMSALYMISQKTLISKAAVYPPLGAYIQIPFLLLAFLISILSGKFTNLSELQFFLVTHEGYFLFVPRLISTVLGTLTIPTVYFIAKELFPKKNRVILLSTFFFALAFNHLQASNFNRPWSGSILFFALAFLFSLKIAKKPSTIKNYLIVGLFSGLSYGFHQVGLFSLILFFLIIFPFSLKGILLKIVQRRILITIIISCSLFLLFNSLIQNKVTSDFFALALSSNTNLISIIYHLLKGNVLILLLTQLIITDPLLIFFSLFSLFNPYFWKKPYLRLSLFILFYLLIIAVIIPGPVRYLLPLIIIFALYSAYTFNLIFSKITPLFLKYIFASLVFLILLYNPIRWHYVFYQKPTFIQLREFINTQINPDIPMLFTSYRMTGYLPSLKAIEAIRQKHPSYYLQLSNLLQQNKDLYPDNVRNIYYLEQLTDPNDDSSNIIDKYHIRYLVDYYWSIDNRSVRKFSKNKLKMIKHYSPLKNKITYIPLFNIAFHIISPENRNLLFFVERPGPYIDVFEVKN